MIQRRRKLSVMQRVEVWRRWKAGESLHAIGRAVGKDHVVVHLLLKRHGGIAPTARRRSRRVLTLAEREDISRGIASGCSLRVIAQRLSRARSTMSREVARHGGRAQYRANESRSTGLGVGPAAQACACWPLTAKLREIVASKLMQDWSPEQISGWLKTGVPERREPARVARNDLSQPVHSSARSAETGAGSAPSLQAADPPLAALQRSRALPRQDRRCDFHPGTTCGSRRSCHSRSLGGRSVARGAQQPRGHAGGASFALLHAGEGARQGHGYRGGRPEPARATTPGGVASLADLGSRAGDGPAQKLHDGYGCTGLLLRSAKSLAARLERKHQRTAAAIPAEEGRPVQLLAVGPGRDRSASESTATKNVGISNSGG